VLIRFGRWQDILEIEAPADYLPFTTALHHAARGISFAAQDKPSDARREQDAFFKAKNAVPKEWIIGNNTCADVLALATHMLEGEISYREGKSEEGLAELRKAVELEDALRYDEPPGWILPVRHALGATLMQDRRFEEAEAVYRRDLERRPENGWSLFGLSEALRLQGKPSEAAPWAERFEKVWAKADIRINSSCLCQPGL
jgi:tetratricopeptide (TPR) repeat protein